MTTFYGESHVIDWGQNISGTPVSTFENLKWHFDNTAETVAAGQSFTIGVYRDSLYATAADDIVFSWVIECESGSSGTLRLHDGMDPGFGFAAAACVNDLGSFDVAGKQTVVATATTVKADYFSLTSEPTLLVECTSGSVVIQQVKLRLIPPGGPSGAWTLYPETSSHTESGAAWHMSNARLGSASVFQYGDATSAAVAALDAARAAAVAAGTASLAVTGVSPQPSPTTPGGDIAGGEVTTEGRTWTLGEPGPGYTGNGLIDEGYGFLTSDVASSTPYTPAGAGNDPYEVWEEEQSWVRSSTGGAVQGTFGGWIGSLVGWTASGTPGATGVGAVAFLTLAANPLTYHDGNQWADNTYYAGGAQTAIPNSATSTSPIDIPLAGGEYVRISIDQTGRSSGTPPLVSSGVGPDGLTGGGSYSVKLKTAATYVVDFDPYLYFDPTLPWVEPSEFFEPGFYLTPNPNLDGALNGVEVNFATT